MAQHDGDPHGGGKDDRGLSIPFPLRHESRCLPGTVIARETGLAAGRSGASYRRVISSHHSLVKRLALQRVLEGHQGCVNTASFTPDGGSLLTGSDDLSVIFWDWERGSQRLKYQSGHFGNVFQARAMPFVDNNTIVTSAADGQVRVGFVRQGTSGRCVETYKVANHHGRAHKLALDPTAAQCFYSCGEDGAVRHFDLRENRYGNRKLLTVMARRYRWQRKKVELYALALNPRSPWQMGLAGGEECVRIYDLRKCGPCRDTESSSGPSGPAEPLFQLCPRHMKHTRGHHTTCVAFNHRGQLLATYSEENIYMFDYEGRSRATGTSAEAGRSSNTRRREAFLDQPGEEGRATRRLRRSGGLTGSGNGGTSDSSTSSDEMSELTEDHSSALGRTEAEPQGEAPSVEAEPVVREPQAGVEGPYEGQGPSNQPRTEHEEGSQGPGTPATGKDSHDAAAAGSSIMGGSLETEPAFGESEGAREGMASGSGDPSPTGTVMQGGADGAMMEGGGHGGREDVREGREMEVGTAGGAPLPSSGRPLSLAVGEDVSREGRNGASEGEEEEDGGRRYTGDVEEDINGGSSSSLPMLATDSDSGSGEDSMPDLMESFDSSSDDDVPVADHCAERADRSRDDFVIGSFSGHVNHRTVKGVSFMGESDEYIVSGSDCGHVFVWDVNTAKLLWAQPGDTAVVNCLEPHPLLPLTLATSGIEPTVKLWAPTSVTQRAVNLLARRHGHMDSDARDLIHMLAANHHLPESIFRSVSSNLASGLLGDSGDDDTEDDDGYLDHPPCLMQ
eukprot:CAMPEP_0117666086 /NCGR_PEP_ID=MMETSP0804-20121206/10173_1 /TAXON_ID=1074897 /ORGANISM="Tetraselmis astigmatica, Strain CCMP880" /LENGTH=788 /DNA_ID=CAMNT_0005473577 /DNA_START=136 /DNA_END=2502 /DNA_ORIENTATION=+